MSDVLSDQPDTLEHYKSEHRALAAFRMLGREPSYMSNEEIVGAILFGSASPVRARRFETASECSREEV